MLENFFIQYLRAAGWKQAASAFLISLVVLALFLKNKHRLTVIRAVGYSACCTLLFVATLLGRSSGLIESSVVTLFSTWQGLLTDNPAGIYEVLYNVVLFLPVGFFFSDCRFGKKKSVLLSFFVSLGIETLQLLTGRGVFEICDLVNNTLGGCLGVIFHSIWIRLWRWIHEEKANQ